MNFLSVVGGAFRYEFAMQVRRRALWIVITLFSAFVLLLWLAFEQSDIFGSTHQSGKHPALLTIQSNAILYWVEFMAWFIPIAVGLLVADRLARDRGTHTDEILTTLPGSLCGRLFGKYLGAILATFIPIILIYALVIAFILTRLPDSAGVWLAVRGFAAIILPAVLFAAGFSLAIPAWMKVPLYQFLFIGYWFWANLMSPKLGIPSPVGTMLNATGPWALEAFFDFQWTFLRLHPTPLQGYESIALLVGLSLLSVLLAWGYLRWRQATA